MANNHELIETLTREHTIIQQAANRMADLSEDFSLLSTVKDNLQDFTPYQYSFINKRMLNLRHQISSFREGLQIHYRREATILRPILGNAVKQTLKIQQNRLLGQVSETEELLLSLSPAGIFFNGPYLQQKLSNLRQSVYDLNTWENSILELAGLYSV